MASKLLYADEGGLSISAHHAHGYEVRDLYAGQQKIFHYESGPVIIGQRKSNLVDEVHRLGS